MQRFIRWFTSKTHTLRIKLKYSLLLPADSTSSKLSRANLADISYKLIHLYSWDGATNGFSYINSAACVCYTQQTPLHFSPNINFMDDSNRVAKRTAENKIHLAWCVILLADWFVLRSWWKCAFLGLVNFSHDSRMWSVS